MRRPDRRVSRQVTPAIARRALAAGWETLDVRPIMRRGERRTLYQLGTNEVVVIVEATPNGVLRDFATLTFEHDLVAVSVEQPAELERILHHPPTSAREALRVLSSAQVPSPRVVAAVAAVERSFAVGHGGHPNSP